MKKEALILPLLLLTACADTAGYEDDSEEFYTEEAYAEESGLVYAEPVNADQNVVAVSEQNVQQVKVSPDGMVIELPAQQINLSDMTVQPLPVPPPMPPRPAVVTLQNMAYPNTFAQCAFEDTACIAAYEQQGYRRLNGTPQFAGYRDQLSHSDYPQEGQWRDNNNIPRW